MVPAAFTARPSASQRAAPSLARQALTLGCVSLCLTTTAIGQGSAVKVTELGDAVGEIRGRAIDAGNGQPISGGSVTVRRAGDSSFVSGALLGANGSFAVGSLRYGSYMVRIRALGFAPLVYPTVTIASGHTRLDLGNLALSGVAAQLDRQVVTAERADVALALDRTSYRVKNIITASGGTAVDVLRAVPSVDSDASGNISIRGNGNVVVQINGRSLPFKGEQLSQVLMQIPAATMASVEVSTSPSAKNDPEGTAGVVNIVLLRNGSAGLGGGFTAGSW